MVTKADNERMTLIDGDAPLGRMMRANYWVPFALSSHLPAGGGPVPVRLFGENYVAFRSADGRVGFMDELCPHRRASLTLARAEENGLRCIYHGWKVDVSGSLAEAPTQLQRPEAFCANVKIPHFPVHEAGNLAWVWLGEAEAPPFPDLPFADEDLYSYMCVSQVPCNWLQGIEGTLDSAHVGMLHHSWIAQSVDQAEHANLTMALDQPPRYQVEATDYGVRAAAIRKTTDGGSYVRVTQHLMPFVTIVPVGAAQPRAGSVFVISPVDDTHHLLFFGYFSDQPHGAASPVEIKMASPDYEPAANDYAGLRGSREDGWGQDRSLMEAGHFTGFGRNLIEEDAVVQTSMGPIVDRTKENLSSSDVGVVTNRRLLLEAVDAFEAGNLPTGSALAKPEPVHFPNAVEVIVGPDESWEDAAFAQLTGSA